MKYKKFIIKRYKAITEPLEIKLEKLSLVPIIGINECGKTTILQAIFAFDSLNDKLNEGLHLKNIENLYSTSVETSEISANIEAEWDDLLDILNDIAKDEQYKNIVNKYKRQKQKYNNELTICRNLTLKEYNITNSEFNDGEFNKIFAEKIIKLLPYILYFDDFRDSVSEKIEIIDKDSASGWLTIIEQLFKKTDKNYSIFTLHKHEQNKRNSIISDVEDVLNAKLTAEWSNFKLDDSDPLKISLGFINEGEGENKRYFLELKIIETIKGGRRRFFGIRDRSKGFYWFFNFVMKLEFNPKVRDLHDKDTIYLLDEPGSYLHAGAQSKLCKKLFKLSKENKVIYCTHSHYLLDPEVIPISNVKISEKDSDGNIGLKSIYDFQGNLDKMRSAFQPLMDALQIKPYIFDLNNKKIVIVEGIIDYYTFNMFNDNRDIAFLPSVNADSIKYYISFMICCRIKYIALWDNDDEGCDRHKEAKEYFGEREADNFLLIPLVGKSRKRILQNLFDGKDLVLIKKELGIPQNSSFKKSILTLYYSDERKSIVKKISKITKNNFSTLFKEFKKIFNN